MLFLYATKQGELAVGTEVKLEAAEPRRGAVEDALGVLTVVLAARLPVAFEDGAAAISERSELGMSQFGATETDGHRDGRNELPAVLATQFISPASARCKGFTN